MEMEPATPAVAKKLWSILRAVFFVLRKGFSKHGKLAGKAFRNLMLQHYSAVSCRSNDALSFVAPRDYEFSCSNSPAYPATLFHKRNHRHRLRNVATLAAVERVLEMLNSESTASVEPPSPAMHLPGFGKSPMVRQLRITDSPFPVNYVGDSHVDTAAEEFIKNFYKDLRLQKGALQSPYHR